MRAFVHTEIRTYSMSCTMQEIISFTPHTLSSYSIQLCSRCSVGEFNQFQLNMRFQNQGINMLHLLRYRSQSNGTGNISSTILVLNSRVYENQTFRLQNDICFRSCLIMNYCSMLRIAGYRIKRNISEQFLLCTQRS